MILKLTLVGREHVDVDGGSRRVFGRCCGKSLQSEGNLAPSRVLLESGSERPSLLVSEVLVEFGLCHLSLRHLLLLHLLLYSFDFFIYKRDQRQPELLKFDRYCSFSLLASSTIGSKCLSARPIPRRPPMVPSL